MITDDETKFLLNDLPCSKETSVNALAKQYCLNATIDQLQDVDLLLDSSVNQIKNQIEQDYLHGQIMEIAGWPFSITQLKLCVLLDHNHQMAC